MQAMKKQKPPLGVMPRQIWLEKRMQELSRAIYERMLAGIIDENVNEWSADLSNLMSDYRDEYGQD